MLRNAIDEGKKEWRGYLRKQTYYRRETDFLADGASPETVFRVAIGWLTAISSGEVKLLKVEIPGDG